ncbi:MAG: lytic transglycosylase domain-containing protein [Clostridia bacterium]|nr:lytic transglycosylase domain-containing protein [Clostridia bacterium]
MNKKALIIFVSITITIIIIIAFDIYSRILKIYYPKTYEAEVNKYASKYEIDENWIFALIKAESNFKENSISSSGAVGLMQLMEKTAKETAEEIRHRI